MGGNDRLYFRADDDLRDRVGRHQAKFGLDNQSEATRHLVEIGLRESKTPVLYRLKDQSIEWAGYLGLAAMVVVAAGFTTTVLTPVHSLQVALVLIAMALGLVAIVELARTARGQSELGEFILRVKQ